MAMFSRSCGLSTWHWGYPDHPRALLTLLEGLALWSGALLCAAISAAHSVGHSLGAGSFGDLEHWPEESAVTIGRATRCVPAELPVLAVAADLAYATGIC
jgi:hypothetical protein